VLEEIVFQPPYAGNSGKLAGIALGGSSSAPHTFCVVRNCAFRGKDQVDPPPSTPELTFNGISPGVGVGTIIEGNQMINLGTGVLVDSVSPPDLVIWNNFLQNVFIGVAAVPGAAPIGRMILLNNIIELASGAGAPAGSTGISLTSMASDMFTEIIARGNQIKDVFGSASSGLYGILLSGVTQGIIENNIVDNTAVHDAVRLSDCGSVKTFNNQTGGGELLRGWNASSSQSQLELADWVQDSLLGF
jgi:hypothetical protein